MHQVFLHFHRFCATRQLILVGLCAVLALLLTGPQPAHAAAVNCADTVTTGVPQTECETLVALYNSTNGPGWTTSTNWNTATAVGTWRGVTVSGGHVTRLSIAENQLNGSLPSLSGLTQLQGLSLPKNQLSGSIPDLSALTHLQRISLENNQLSGSIPNLSTLTQLGNLDLNSNQLSGSIPDLSTLTKLQFLELGWNQLSGSIPDLSTLTQLRWLDLPSNQLSGSIPDLSGLTSLELLILRNNQLSGSIPNLSTLTQLKRLFVDNNLLSGSIPDLSSLTLLEYLNLAGNQLVSLIPSSITVTKVSYPYLDLCGGSNIIASLDLTVVAWVQAREYGGFTQGCGRGTTPTATADPDYNAPADTTLTVSAPGVLENDMLGTPAGIVTFFGSGSLGGAVTDYASGMTVNPLPGYSNGSLQVNADGSFVFDPPADFSGSYTFQYRLNNGVGTFDATVNIEVIDVCSQLAITGISQAECQALVALYNSTNGPGWMNKTNWNSATAVSTWYGVTVSSGHVTGLDLYSNQLSGNIPDLSSFTQLQILDLSDNQLGGNIPNLSGLTQLTNLKLSNNQLVSPIPQSITGTAITSGNLSLCGGNNLITSTDPMVISWVQARDPGWTQGCSLTAPTATADSDYVTTRNTTLTVSPPGVLANDTVGVPIAALSSFGGGSLGGAVTSHAAGTTVSPLPGYSDGSLRVNADGNFVFTPPTNFSGIYTFQYHLNNLVGVSDAVVSIAVSSFCAQTVTTGVPQAECEALVALYNSTNGPGWTNKTNWNTATAVSSWYGVTVSGEHVTKIELAALGLTGNIPNLTGLTQLQTLTLIGNQLSGSLVALLLPPQLEVLMLGGNQLSGSLSDLSLPPQLTMLSLGNNQITGTIPDLTMYTQLAGLELSNNQLSGSIPDLSGYPQLVLLMLGGNQLNGSIPELSANSQLWYLDLSDNQLSGSIPDLSALTKLEYLNLSSNQLVSLVPPSITVTALSLNYDLYLCGGNNIIASPDPAVMTWVRQRDLGWTQGCGRGTAPTAIANSNYATPASTTLTVSAPGVLANDTAGTPAGIVTSFGGGSLGGAVADHAAGSTVSPLPTYSGGSLQVNPDGGFVFTPPTGFSGNYTFQYRLNNGVGTSDATVTIVVSAVSSVCAQTAITGVPQAECEALVTFYNTTNGSGWTNSTNWNTATSVSTWYGVLISSGHVTVLDLPANQLSGTIPDLSALTNVRRLWLPSNQLSGSIPDLSGLTNLEQLYLNNNQLSGNIPNLSALSQLQRIDLSSNQLSGNIPNLSALTQLQELVLHDNQLIGSIPDLSALTYLWTLDLSHNQLVSMIPAAITGTSITTTSTLSLCGGDNIISSPDPTVTAWVQQRDTNWTQGCGLGTAPTTTNDSDYTTALNTVLTVTVPGVLANDTVGVPAVALSSFGGGSLGGVVTAHAAGTTASPLPGYSNGSLRVNADGSFVFTPPTVFSGNYTFQYRLNNGVGTSDATVTIAVSAVSSICAQTAITGVPQTECEALVALYNSTNGPNWKQKYNWDTATAVDNWFGVTVTDGHVTSIALSYNDLRGSIPDLSALAHLELLYLSDNQLSGNIPDLSAFTNLENLDLSINQLSGSIPDLSALTQLGWLYLNNNQLSGSIPDLSALTQLHWLFLNDNQLSGTIPDLSAFTQMSILRLHQNQLVSLIPPSIMSMSTSIDHMSLCGGSNIIASNNSAVTTLVQANDPGWTQGCGRGTAPITTADPAYTAAANTTFTISAPGVLANDTLGTPGGNITFFGGGSLGGVVTAYAAGTTASPLPGYSNGSLRVNADGSFVFTPPTGFTGTYTFQYRLNNGVGVSDATVTIAVSEVSNFCTQTAITGVPRAECEALVTFYNTTNGSGWTNSTNWNTATAVDTWFGVTVSGGHITGLSLNSNQLSGSLLYLSGFTQLQQLDLSSNQLSGRIPSLSGLTQLWNLNLSSNQLSGGIPSLSSLTLLKDLSLSSNQLSGSIPDLSALTQLQQLDLSTNQMSGSIPDLSALTQLQQLDLSGNQLSGSIPDLSALTQLHTLLLIDNQLSGSIPDLSALTQLHNLNLNTNQLSGSIPDLSGLSQLQYLVLCDNQLSGSIPDLSDLTQLQYLGLSPNQLVSVIPPSITATAISPGKLYLCGGNNIIASPHPAVTAWVEARDINWTQGCGLGTASTTTNDPDYTTALNTVLTVAAPGVLANDTVGIPAVALSSFGGGLLGDLVTDHAAGAIVSPLPTYSDGSLRVNADGSFDFTPPTDFSGSYTFQYRLDNGVGASDGVVTIEVIPLPALSINNGVGFESNTARITFTVTRTGATDGTSTVQYVTADGTATAGSDYLAKNGTLTFGPGIATRAIVIVLRGDAVVEGNETFFVNLSNPMEATITDAQGQGVIRNSTVKPRLPADDDLLRDTTPVFAWNAIATATQYRLQVSTTATFASPVIDTIVSTTSYTPTSALTDGLYYWRVMAGDASDVWGSWCTRWIVTIDSTAPAQPILLLPANGASITDNTPLFRWQAVAGAVEYILQMDNDATFASPIIDRTLSTTSYLQPRALANRIYYWRVRAVDAAGNVSTWSARWSFTVNAVPMAQPTLIPTNTLRPSSTLRPTLVPSATLVPTVIPTATPTAIPTDAQPRLQLVESDLPVVVQSGVWTAYDEPSASGGRYLLSSTPADALTMAFVGTQVAVVYIQHPAVGSFAVEVDGVLMQTVESVAAEAVFGAEVTISGLVYGQHVVKVYPVSGVVAIDAFRVETALEVVIPTATPVPTDVPTNIPTAAPTETPVPTDIPTDVPTETPVPTDVPTDVPTETPIPTEAPTLTPVPTDVPTAVPTEELPPVEMTEEPVS